MKKSLFTLFVILSCGTHNTYSQVQSHAVAQPETTKVFKPNRPLIVFEINPDTPLGKSFAAGKIVYFTNCLGCHGDKGQGVKGVFPPLAKADFIADVPATIRTTLKGIKGKMMVNGEMYDSEMDGYAHLTDQEITDLMNYVQNSWGNRARMTGINQIKSIRTEMSNNKFSSPKGEELTRNNK
jgi:mono/diheme cytochrome c family protein